jgi:hypothetical protein
LDGFVGVDGKRSLADPIVVSTVEWPQTLAAICGGSPERMASVTKMRLVSAEAVFE